MIRYSPKIDLVFRKLFGSEENKVILLSLVNSILNFRSPIKDLTIKNPYNLATYVGGKTSILDIKAVDENGTWYDIELQIGEQGFYGKRALYYLSKMYVDQLENAEQFSLLNKTIGIHLIDFKYFYDERYARHFVYKDNETNEYDENLSYQQLYFIELSKFNKDWSESRTLLERWVTFLNRAHRLEKGEIPQEIAGDSEMVMAAKKLDEMSFTREELEIYESERKKRMDAQEELRTALEKGKDEGRKEGREEGLDQALKKMISSGITEIDAKRILGL
ncbi:MAG: Rpn family recombination-promoting nuclease/putative transposase [Candidatus Riflebacteria bacterium]|nr:Rpn family recombination-promoting nuclease/putative transposase [Candidatus Riflebacteria bacterium]